MARVYVPEQMGASISIGSGGLIESVDLAAGIARLP